MKTKGEKYNGLNRRIKVRKKGLAFLFRILFGRTMIMILLILLQILFLVSIINKLGTHSDIGLTITQILAVFVVIYIVNSEENPAFKLAWMVPVCAFPVFGTLLFLFVQSNPGSWGLKIALDKRVKETRKYLKTSKAMKTALENEGNEIKELAHYIENFNYFPCYSNTNVEYMRLGEEKFKDLLIELEKAEKFIFLEYFIIARGYMWDKILEILKRKAAEGVEVRVMYDGTCTIVNLPYHYEKKLAQFGIKAQVFAPIKPLLSTHQNNRDHRKILVIDGKVAYTGGINLADEYINEIELYGHWKDVSIKLRGDAVKSFTIMFLQLWNLNHAEKENYENYIDVNHGGGYTPELGFVIPYNDDPANREDVAEKVYLDILYKARNYVYIMTPYLITDNEMIVALCFAAQRGVDVKLMLPHIPDKKVAFYIARTFYKQLMSCGVKIYEYTPGFLHAKMFVSDDVKAVVGTINLDFRSLYEHFECAAFIYKNPVIKQIKQDFNKTIKKSTLITTEEYKKIPLITRWIGQIFKIFGPLM